ncbi:MAG: hypothetical protein ACI9ZT_000745 [Gammaproteobacteria bacterium]|jgi:hypothetical protein
MCMDAQVPWSSGRTGTASLSAKLIYGGPIGLPAT